jgi:hypothetical protein
LVVEHKGADRLSTDESEEKRGIGELCDAKGLVKALFLMTVVEKGRPVLFDQIEGKR